MTKRIPRNSPHAWTPDDRIPVRYADHPAMPKDDE